MRSRVSVFSQITTTPRCVWASFEAKPDAEGRALSRFFDGNAVSTERGVSHRLVTKSHAIASDEATPLKAQSYKESKNYRKYPLNPRTRFELLNDDEQEQYATLNRRLLGALRRATDEDIDETGQLEHPEQVITEYVAAVEHDLDDSLPQELKEQTARLQRERIDEKQRSADEAEARRARYNAQQYDKQKNDTAMALWKRVRNEFYAKGNDQRVYKRFKSSHSAATTELVWEGDKQVKRVVTLHPWLEPVGRVNVERKNEEGETEHVSVALDQSNKVSDSVTGDLKAYLLMKAWEAQIAGTNVLAMKKWKFREFCEDARSQMRNEEYKRDAMAYLGKSESRPSIDSNGFTERDHAETQALESDSAETFNDTDGSLDIPHGDDEQLDYNMQAFDRVAYKQWVDDKHVNEPREVWVFAQKQQTEAQEHWSERTEQLVLESGADIARWNANNQRMQSGESLSETKRVWMKRQHDKMLDEHARVNNPFNREEIMQEVSQETFLGAAQYAQQERKKQLKAEQNVRAYQKRMGHKRRNTKKQNAKNRPSTNGRHHTRTLRRITSATTIG